MSEKGEQEEVGSEMSEENLDANNQPRCGGLKVN